MINNVIFVDGDYDDDSDDHNRFQSLDGDDNGDYDADSDDHNRFQSLDGDDNGDDDDSNTCL